MSVRVFPATVTSVYDGDTCVVFADCGFAVWRFVDVRLDGINAIELHSPGGAEGRDHLLSLIPVGSAITLTALKWDKYGDRVDSKITLSDGRDVGAVMIADGYAAPYNGRGPKPTPPWPILA